jgi:Glycosyltransferase 61
MITDEPDINALLIPNISRAIRCELPSHPAYRGDKPIIHEGLEVVSGKALVSGAGCILPIVDGKTSTSSFFEYHPNKLGNILSDLPPSSDKAVSNAVITTGHGHYFHFLANHLPALLLLANRATGHTTLATAFGYPTSLHNFIPYFAQLAAGQECQFITLPPGVYDVSNVIFSRLPHHNIAPAIGRKFILPLVLKKAGVTDVLRELGPLKLFVRRETHTMGRSLLNQLEVEAWFVERGYKSINPGNLSFAEQVILFSRATHIAGVEGGSLTNLMFAENARQVIMIASPNTVEELFFQNLLLDWNVPFHSLYGQCLGAPPFERNADFVLPIHELSDLISEAIC